MNRLVFIYFISISTILFYSCKSTQKDDKPNDFFPVLSFLKSQVAHVDTSLFQIIKIENENGRSDTTYLKREEFKLYAKDFTTIPDITSDDLKDEYTETKMYDDALQRVVLSYVPKENDAEIQRQDITIAPNEDSSKVETIYVDWLIDDDDSLVQKKMLWQMDKKFQVITSISKPGQPERLKTVQVMWKN
jgi:hypothetical protein